MAANGGTGETAKRQRGSLLWVSGVLALLLVIAKAATIHHSANGGAAWAATLLRVSWADVLFALSLGIVGEAATRLMSRWRIAAGFVWWFVVGVMVICAFYGVVAVGVFSYFNQPLTAGMLSLVKNAAVVGAYAAERLTLPIALALIAAPLLVLVAAFVRPRAMIAIVVVLTGWSAAGMLLHNRPVDDSLGKLALNPHVELVRSGFAMLRARHAPALPDDVTPEEMAEFRTFRGRGSLALGHFTPPEGVERPRNLIVVVLESVGTKYLRLYGHGAEYTPHLTAAAEHALVFENIYAPASFSYAAFRPINFGVNPGLPWRYSLVDEVRPRPATLAKLLKQQRGARTFYVTNGDLDWEDQRWLLETWGGYDAVEGPAHLGCPLQSTWNVEDRCAVERLLRWIDERPGEPFAAVWWSDGTHDPYQLSDGWREIDFVQRDAAPFASELNRYLNLLHEADALLGRLFALLRERGIAEETLVVITGDHGEAFGDPRPQRGHAWSVFEEEVRVPLLLWNPRLFPNGGRVEQVGGLVDLKATVADVLGLEADAEWQGRSLFDTERENRAYFFAIGSGNVFGVREGEWKYSYDVATRAETLFHLGLDPLEQHNIAAAEPELSRRLLRRVTAWVRFQEAYLAGREN